MQPETRQYKVMTFGSRRITLRNRRFLRKYTPVQIPENTPSGFTKNLTAKEHAPVEQPPVPAKRQQQPPVDVPDGQDRTLPIPTPTMQQESIQVPLQCEPDCCTRPVPVLENAEPVPKPPTATASWVPQLPDVYTPTPVPVPTTPPPGPPLRRSDRAGRGQTSRYDDFVQQILYTEPTYQNETPAGIYNTGYPHDLIFFRRDAAGNQTQIQKYYPLLMNGTGMLNNLHSSYLSVKPT